MSHYQSLLDRYQITTGLEQAWIGEHIKVCTPVNRALINHEKLVKIGSCFTDLISHAVPGTSDSETVDVHPKISNVEMKYFHVDCNISSNGIVTIDDTIFIEDFRNCNRDWMEWGFKGKLAESVGFYGLDMDKMTAIVENESGGRTISEPSFFFDTVTSQHNFGHFIHDTLTQVIAYDYLCDLTGTILTPIIAGPFHYEMQHFLFDRLVKGASKTQFIGTDSSVNLTDCYLTTRPLYHPEAYQITVNAVRYLRDKLQELVPATEDIHYKNIYTTRHDIKAHGSLIFEGRDYSKVWKQGRLFNNIHAVDQTLAKYNFYPLVMNQYTPQETINLFKNAENVVGIHGGSLMNFIFSSKCQNLIELCDYPYSWESIFVFASACNIKATRVPAYPTDTGVNVNIDVLEDTCMTIQ